MPYMPGADALLVKVSNHINKISTYSFGSLVGFIDYRLFITWPTGGGTMYVLTKVQMLLPVV